MNSSHRNAILFPPEILRGKNKLKTKKNKTGLILKQGRVIPLTDSQYTSARSSIFPCLKL